MKLVLLVVCFYLVNASPYGYNGFRPKRAYPHQGMMFSGFYSRPNYLPPRGMTAFASRDAIATNSFAGGNYPDYMAIPLDESFEHDRRTQAKPEIHEETKDEVLEDEADEEIIVSTTLKPKRIPKRKPTTPAPADDEDEEDDSLWPMKNGNRQSPGYNAFFPIIFGSRGGGGGNSRNGEHEGGYPGSATAIANSFSTGKGGVASSHATAYGDPYMSTLLRNMKRKNMVKNKD